MLKQIFRFFYPDTSEVKTGTLWLANKKFYIDRYSCHDLLLIGDIMTSGGCRVSCVDHMLDWSPPPPLLKAPMYSWLKDKTHIVRSHKIISKQKAIELGFDCG